MTGSMTLVIHKDTKHALAVATKAANPDENPAAADLVGDGLLIRDPTTGQTLLQVAADDLEAIVTDADGSVLVAPRHFEFDNDTASELPALNNPLIGLNGTQVTVNLNANVTQETDVPVYILGGQMAVTEKVTVTIPANNQQGSGAATLGNGAYHALALPPGFRPFTDEDTVP